MDEAAGDFELAGTLVRAAGRLAARMLAEGPGAGPPGAGPLADGPGAGSPGAGLGVERKTSVSDLVSAADHAAEALVAERLRAARPGDGLLGEEGTARTGERTWVIDPVDGTYNFLSGLPFWCSALALVAADGPVLGAVYAPVTDELWLGGPGHPTTRNGVPVGGPSDRPLDELSLASYLHPPRLGDAGLREPGLRAVGAAATVRMLGSGSVELACVASGRLGAWLQTDAPDWDWLPGATLVRAAGGTAETFDAHGHRWHTAGSARAVATLTACVRGG